MKRPTQLPARTRPRRPSRFLSVAQLHRRSRPSRPPADWALVDSIRTIHLIAVGNGSEITTRGALECRYEAAAGLLTARVHALPCPSLPFAMQ